MGGGRTCSDKVVIDGLCDAPSRDPPFRGPYLSTERAYDEISC